MSTLKVGAIRGTGASSDAVTINATDGTCTAKLTSIGGNQLSGRNVIINGGMLVAQRGTSSTDTQMKTVDRIQFVKSNTDQLAWTQKQVDDYPDGFSKSYEIDVTTAETALAADELCYIRYKVEAQDLRPFYKASGAGRNFTLSFWVKAKQTGTYQVSIHKEDNGVRFITATYTISVADTWERKSITFTGDTGTTGINADAGQGFDITWKLAVGTDYTSGGAQTTWGSFSNAVFGGGHAVDFTSSTANYYRITGIQLEVGDIATEFEQKTFAEELQRCLRYYEHSYPYGNYAGNTSHDGSYQCGSSQVTCTNTTGRTMGSRLTYRVNKRNKPTATIWDFGGNSGKLFRHSYGSSGSNNQSADAGNWSDTGFNMYSEGSSSATGWMCHWVADAEL
tara:strand:+ start:1 stop:1182 length:1182 start_codon:yes stop_codon:yes gene_type:complete